MNPYTGHLVADINEVEESKRGDYKPVPKWLHELAATELQGEPETTINLNLQSNLTAWAAKERKKNRTRAKIAKRSRARNRK